MKARAEDFEELIWRVLRSGMLCALTLLFLGLVLSEVSSTAKLSQLLLHAGIIMVLLTPVARLVSSLIYFARERDWIFFAVTTGVLCVVGSTFFTAFQIANP